MAGRVIGRIRFRGRAVRAKQAGNLRDIERLLQNYRFEAILLHEQSRFSREDIFDVMLHWRLLREAGVDIVTCQRGRLCFDDRVSG